MGTPTRLKASTKRAALGLLHSTAVLSGYHKLRNRCSLTVVSFHRVLPEADLRWRTAHPLWTVSQQLFDDCLDFFVRYYTPISLQQVSDAVCWSAPLPDCPLLITFDDGWADNAEGALQSLAKRGIPAVLFAVAEALNTGRLWQEPILRAWELGLIPADSPMAKREALLEFLGQAANLEEPSRQAAERRLCPGLQKGTSREMLSPEQLRALQREGITVGSHGFTHSALAVLRDPGAELRRSRKILETELDEKVMALSFPHGSYNQKVLREAKAAGYNLLFTSDACLNVAVEQSRPPALLGRIPILASEVSGKDGRLSPELLARWLFIRPRRTLRTGI